MTIAEIKQHLKFGDTQYIAKQVGKSKALVNKVLNGERNNEDVLAVAKVVAENNRSMTEQINLMLTEV